MISAKIGIGRSGFLKIGNLRSEEKTTIGALLIKMEYIHTHS